MILPPGFGWGVLSPCHPTYPVCATHTVHPSTETVSTTLFKAVCFVEESGYGLAFEGGLKATLGGAIDE